MHYHTAGAGSVGAGTVCGVRLGSAVVGEMNNFRTGTQLRARTSRVPSSRSTDHARTYTPTRRCAPTTPWRARVTRPLPSKPISPHLPGFVHPGRSTILVSFIFHCGQLFRAPAVPIGCPISSNCAPKPPLAVMLRATADLGNDTSGPYLGRHVSSTSDALVGYIGIFAVGSSRERR